MCWNIATALLDNNVLLERKFFLYLDLFLWEDGYYCDPVNARSCSYGSLFASFGGKLLWLMYVWCCGHVTDLYTYKSRKIKKSTYLCKQGYSFIYLHCT